AWFRSRRFAGSGDRRAIAERVFSVQRHRAALEHRMGNDCPRALMIAALLESGEDVEALFTGGYGPAPLTDAERAAMASTPAPVPDWVRGEYPHWLESEFKRAFGDRLAAEMQGFIGRAPTDLRVNTLKATRAEMLRALQKQGVTASATAYARHGIRIAGEAGNLSETALFKSGAFEIQDEAAQIASGLCAAAPGMRVLDLAAGAGGESLALAAVIGQGEGFAAGAVRGE